jgi:hypothetical protein
MQALLIQNYQQQYIERSEEPQNELAFRKFTVLIIMSHEKADL